MLRTRGATGVTTEDSTAGTSKESSLTPSSTPPDSKRVSWFVVKAILLGSLGGLVFGYDVAVMSHTLPQLETAFELTESQLESILSFVYLGGIFGSFIGGLLCDIIGRKHGILFTSILYIIGALVLTAARSYHALLVGRFVEGFAISSNSICGIAYLYEISPVPSLRGTFVGCYQAFLCVGLWIAYASNFEINLAFPDNGWRIMVGLASLVSYVQFMGMLFMPESPRWLLSKGRIDEAMECNRRIGIENMSSPVPPSDKIANSSDEKTAGEARPALQARSSIIFEFQERYPVPQTLVVIFLASMGQFCGHTNVLSFASEIFKETAMYDEYSFASMLFLSVVKLSATLFVLWKIESIGRPISFNLGLLIMSFSLLTMAIAFLKGDEHVQDVFLEALVVIGVLGVVIGFTLSFGPLNWLITSEMFPTNSRGKMLGLLSIVTAMSGLVVSYTFLSFQSSLGNAAPFFIYFVISILSLIFSLIAIPDTGGKSPEEVDEEIRKKWFWRTLGYSPRNPVRVPSKEMQKEVVC